MSNSIKNILVPVDFSHASFNAVNTAIKMCQRHSASLHLLNITTPEYFYPTAGMQAPVFTLAEEMLRNDIENLDNYASSIRRDQNLDCISHSEVGPITSTISRVAEESDCDLIVMGTGSETGGYCTSKIANGVLQYSNCPVMAVPADTVVNIFKKVIFPIRAVLQASDKYEFSKKIFRKNDSKVHVVGSLRLNDTSKYPSIRRMVRHLENTLTKDKIDHSSEYRFSNDIVENLAEKCNKASADLIIITPTTKNAFKRFFCKSYAQKIMDNARSAVLCIKPKLAAETFGYTANAAHSTI